MPDRSRRELLADWRGASRVRGSTGIPKYRVVYSTDGFPHTRVGGPTPARFAASRETVSPHVWGPNMDLESNRRVTGFSPRVGVDRIMQQNVFVLDPK